MVRAEREKARQETRKGAWYGVRDAIDRSNFMDKKNKAVLEKLLPKILYGDAYGPQGGHGSYGERGDY